MKNANKLTYKELLTLLRNKTYAAPDNWDSIVEELELSERLEDLPQFKAPDGLWSGIEKELPEKTKQESRKGRSFNGLPILAVGILIGMLLLGSIQLFLKKENSQEFRYKSEVELASLLENKTELDENVNEVLEYIENNSFLFDAQQLAEFNEQLEEINQALEQLIIMQEKYGLDQSSNKLMVKIERERTNLLKSMIASTG